MQGLSLSVANNVLGVVGSSSNQQPPGNLDDSRIVSAISSSSTASIQPLVLSRRAWQCGPGFQLLSRPVQVSTFDFGAPLADVHGAASLLPTASGLCHAIVMWLDYRLTPTLPASADQASASQQDVLHLEGNGNVCVLQTQPMCVDGQQAEASRESLSEACVWVDNAPFDCDGVLRFEAGSVAVALLPVPLHLAVSSAGEGVSASGVNVSALFHCSDGEMDIGLLPL